MKEGELIDALKAKLGAKAVSVAEGVAEISSSDLREAFKFCAEDSTFRADYFECLIGSDIGQELQLLYRLYSTLLGRTLQIRVILPREGASVPSATEFWGGAANHEREVWEMLGVKFSGHPDLRHLFLPEGWQGYPLRKDYVFPEEFGGIEHRRAPLRKEHPKP